MRRIMSFLRDESGAETVEYAVVAGLVVALAALAYTTGLGTSIKTYLDGLI